MRISGIARLIACSVLACVLSPVAARAADDVSEINRLVRQGDATRALQRIDSYLASNPGDVKIRFQKGLLLAGRGSIAEAIVEFSTLIRDYPEIPEPYNNLAVLYASRGEYEKARAALETAIRLNPAYAIAQENLGNVRAKLAGQAYEKSRALDKSNTGSQAKVEATSAPSVDASSKKVESRKPEAAKPAPLPSAKTEVASIAAAGSKSKSVENVARLATPPPASDGAVSATTTSADGAADVVAALKRWAQAWSNRDASAYLDFYAPEFKVPDGESRARWEAERRARIDKPRKIEVAVLDPKVSVTNKNRAEVSFQQDYRADTFSSRVNKTIVFTKKDGNWLIVEERVLKSP
jgi:tetratricopeptide (TPR) repeat protein